MNNITHEFLTVREIVYIALNTVPETRDNDRELDLFVWEYVYPDLPEEFKELYRRLPKAKWNERARRKIQARFPNLRGELYDSRHNKNVPEVHDLVIDDKL